MQVSLIIVNYNTKELIMDCLKSVYDKTHDIDFEVIVVDNASSDGSIELMKSEYPDVRLIENSDNLGFGKANNIGLKSAKGQYVFLLNSDTVLLNNAVKKFYDFMQENQGNMIGAIGGYLLDSKLNIIHSYNEFPTLSSLFFADLKILMDLFKRKKSEIPTVKPVGYITGADLFLSKSLLNEIGAFDPEYFMYFEETDLQYRMSESGYARLVVPGPEIIHLEGKSSSISNKRRLIFEESKFKYLKKYNNRLLVTLYKYYYILFRFPRVLKFNYSLKENIKYFVTLLKV